MDKQLIWAKHFSSSREGHEGSNTRLLYLYCMKFIQYRYIDGTTAEHTKPFVAISKY